MPRSTAPRTHCRNQHELTPENTRLQKDGERKCRQCERDRDERRRRKNGVEPRQPAQDRTTYLREYRRRWISNRRAAFLAGKSCKLCGSVDRLEVDHIDPALKLDHKVWSWAEDRRAEELAKCQVLCEECHKDKTRRQRREQAAAVNGGHGTSWGYKHGCKCSPCVGWNSARVRRYRSKRKTE